MDEYTLTLKDKRLDELETFTDRLLHDYGDGYTTGTETEEASTVAAILLGLTKLAKVRGMNMEFSVRLIDSSPADTDLG